MKEITHWTEIILFQKNFDESATQVSFKSTISSHLELQFAQFVHYFPAENMPQLGQNACIRNPYQADIAKVFCLLQIKLS